MIPVLSVLVVVLLGALLGLVLFVLPPLRRRVQTLEAERESLRAEKAELERRLAAEEQKALRVGPLEEAEARLEAEREALRVEKAAIEQALAVERQKSTAREQAVLDYTNRLETAVQKEQTLRGEINAARDRIAALEADLAKVTTALEEKGGTLEKLRHDYEALQQESGELRDNVAALREDKGRLEETLTQERKQTAEKIALLQEAREEMARQFRVLAEEVMRQHGETFSRQNRDQIDGLLTPLRDKLAEFQKNLQDAHTESAKEQARLAEQIRHLSETSARMTRETENLTRALKGKVQTQGAWGEMLLAHILERSGLREGEEYVKQESMVSEEGERLRPDVIVNLPDNRRIVIDSKVSLTAFEAAVNAEDEESRKRAMAAHLDSMRRHIAELGEKPYARAAKSELDYVIMFVPIEGALALALESDPELTSYAVERNVAIATPTTLMIALRTVANIWQVERRNRNAEEIANRAGKVYDKFVGFIDDMKKLGERLDQAQKSYHSAWNKLKDGRGSITRQLEDLRLMGARASKALPRALIDGEGEAIETGLGEE
jgi:DNA recombination protein RmuC